MKLWSTSRKKSAEPKPAPEESAKPKMRVSRRASDPKDTWRAAIFGDGPVDLRAALREWWFICLMIVYALVSVLFLSRCGYPTEPSASESRFAAQAGDRSAAGEQEATYTQATLAYAGDLVCHEGLNTEAQTGDTYDYLPILEGCVPYVSDADLAFCCMETTFLDNAAYSGYPMFRSPKELATSLKDAGFDFINTASNHSMDSLKDGISSTLDVLDAAGLDHIGTYRTQEERDANHGVVVKDLNGISIAFLSYTYGTNCIPIEGFEYAVNVCFTDYLDTYADEITEFDYDKVGADLEYARSLDTDLICVFMHWGIEYHTEPVDYQRDVADWLFEQGADLVCGGHPHVPEPMEVRHVKDLDGNERTGYLCYCMGNFISTMNDRYTNLTGVTTIELEKNESTGETYLKNVSYAPLIMVDTADYGIANAGWRYKLVDIHQAIDSYDAGDDLGYINQTLYDAMCTALDDLHDIFGIRFDRFDPGYKANTSGELPVPEKTDEAA
ncbi:MAG: CapA family protein [Oscillospiraceae bacterium]|nr:CapA family protein [Oscillospiraceae bacterium]MBQ9046113.1 CapA family protein [Oscillospiraceae bacterium]